jgi:hypothetical protein
MARVSSNNITSLSDDWGCDPLDDNKPFSGAAVQQFIKSYLGAISRASYFDSTSNTLYWFASDDDKSAFIGDTTLTNLVLFSTTMSFASELFRIVLTNNNGSTTINVATNEPTINLSIDFDVQTKTMTESAWRNTGKGVYVSVQVDAGAYGDYVTVMNPRFFAAESTVVVDVRSYIVVGQNRVKVNFVSEDDNTVVSSITYTISEKIAGSKARYEFTNLKFWLERDERLKLKKNIRISIVVNRYNAPEILMMLRELSYYDEQIAYVQLRKVYKFSENEKEDFQQDAEAFELIKHYIQTSFEKVGSFKETPIYQFINPYAKCSEDGVYDDCRLNVSLWEDVFDPTQIRSMNYFSDGKISENHLLVPGHENEN